MKKITCKLMFGFGMVAAFAMGLGGARAHNEFASHLHAAHAHLAHAHKTQAAFSHTEIAHFHAYKAHGSISHLA